MGASDRVRGDREACEGVRPSLDVRLERARRRITVYELARIMGTSVSMIEAHYGALLDTAHTGLLDRLESFVALEWHEPEAEDA